MIFGKVTGVSLDEKKILGLKEIVRPGAEEIGDLPKEYGSVDFLSEDGRFASGVWRGTAGIIPIQYYPVDEHCTILTGEVTLTDADGNSETYREGMSFVVRKGFCGSWFMPSDTVKLFACYGSAETVSAMAGS